MMLSRLRCLVDLIHLLICTCFILDSFVGCKLKFLSLPFSFILTTLNGLNGTHASEISVMLKNLNNNDIIFEIPMAIGGRLNQFISNEKVDEQATYELVFKTGNYWEKVMNDKNYQNIIQDIVIRFKMPNNNKKYHFPIILSPNSYSTWWSQGE